LTKLNSFCLPFHAVDEFHLFHNFGVLLIELLSVNSSKNVKSNTCYKYLYQPSEYDLIERKLSNSRQWPYPFDISSEDLKEITFLVETPRSTIPTFTFELSVTDPISGKSHGYRGVDNIEALLYLIPTLFAPRLKYSRAKKPVLALCMAASLILKWNIDSDDLSIIERLECF
jgi:hypothetical protein